MPQTHGKDNSRSIVEFSSSLLFSAAAVGLLIGELELPAGIAGFLGAAALRYLALGREGFDDFDPRYLPEMLLGVGSGYAMNAGLINLR